MRGRLRRSIFMKLRRSPVIAQGTQFVFILVLFDLLDPPVVIMLEDEMLPDKYENKEVLWIETEADHKIWPYSNRSWKRLRRK